MTNTVTTNHLALEFVSKAINKRYHESAEWGKLWTAFPNQHPDIRLNSLYEHLSQLPPTDNQTVWKISANDWKNGRIDKLLDDLNIEYKSLTSTGTDDLCVWFPSNWYEQVVEKNNDRFIIEPETYFTEADKARSYNWITKLRPYLQERVKIPGGSNSIIYHLYFRLLDDLCDSIVKNTRSANWNISQSPASLTQTDNEAQCQVLLGKGDYGHVTNMLNEVVQQSNQCLKDVANIDYSVTDTSEGVVLSLGLLVLPGWISSVISSLNSVVDNYRNIQGLQDLRFGTDDYNIQTYPHNNSVKSHVLIEITIHDRRNLDRTRQVLEHELKLRSNVEIKHGFGLPEQLTVLLALA